MIHTKVSDRHRAQEAGAARIAAEVPLTTWTEEQDQGGEETLMPRRWGWNPERGKEVKEDADRKRKMGKERKEMALRRER